MHCNKPITPPLPRWSPRVVQADVTRTESFSMYQTSRSHLYQISFRSSLPYCEVNSRSISSTNSITREWSMKPVLSLPRVRHLGCFTLEWGIKPAELVRRGCQLGYLTHDGHIRRVVFFPWVYQFGYFEVLDIISENSILEVSLKTYN